MPLTKAQMLLYLIQKLPQIHILPVEIVHGHDLLSLGDSLWREICERLRPFHAEAIVRSSCRGEDTAEASNAGKFESILHVNLTTTEALRCAVEKVWCSYGTDDLDEEILIQPMLADVACSGVVFTADMETLADYYTVNYQEGSDTEAVTSGATNAVKTFIRYKFAPTPIGNPDMERLLSTCAEIESFLNNDTLDIEFGITKNHEVYIFQVRPIAHGEKKEYERLSLKEPLSRIYRKVQKLGRPHPFLLGRRTLFGVMPDWNPAEILGLRPKKLALSLYKELITDQVWAHQRTDYGYRNLTMHPLMASFCGIPYIDTRITFNSFIPASLHAHLGEKLVNHYLKRLETYPAYHDKIEFEIVFSCYYFGIAKKLRALLSHGFNENELKRIEFSLLELTNHIIHPQTGIYKTDIQKAARLEKNYRSIADSELSLVDRIYWLIEECKAYGTLPFAGVARAAFIAVQFLDSMVREGLLSAKQKEQFLNSLQTVAKQMKHDSLAFRNGSMSREAFLKKYGHIRPGTYDIASPRYDEAFDEYFSSISPLQIADANNVDEEFTLTKDQLAIIDRELEDNGLEITAEELLVFMKEAIEGREYLKFVFTKCVSEILRLIGELGKRMDIEKDDLAYLDIPVIKSMYVDLYVGTIDGILRANIRANKKQYAILEQLKLPSLIANPDMVYQFYLLQEEPTFITQKKAVGTPVEDVRGEEDISGKIVFIPSADPGYDFLFDKGIGGLVTQFGGMNSHMAIRCAELGLPAVIGVGEKNFQTWKKASCLEIDCRKKQVLPIAL